MSESGKKRQVGPSWTDVLLSVSTLLLAALLIWQCIATFRTGNAPDNFTAAGVRINDVYSREIVGMRLGSIAWAFWLWLAALEAAIVWRMARPEQVNKPAPDPRTRLDILLRRVEKTPEMLAEEKKRKLVTVACGVICALCAVPAAIYLLNIEHFTSWDLESVMGAMLLNVGPWVLIAFVALFVRAQISFDSTAREAAAAAKAPKLEKTLEKTQKASGNGTKALRIALYVAAVALVVLGIINGGMRDVLVKAINICTECIGLG